MHHFTEYERYKLEGLLRAGTPKGECARILGKSRSTIYREYDRGKVELLGTDYIFREQYCADVAQRKADEAATAKGAPLKIGKRYDVANFIETKIKKEKYSPYAVSVELRQKGFSLSTGTIYNYINQEVLNVGRKDLPEKGQRKRRTGRSVQRPAFANIDKPNIADRPKEIDFREDFGHWEIDTVIGTAKGQCPVLLTLTERKTRFEVVEKIYRKRAKYVIEAVKRIKRRYGPQAFKTITADNGSEFASYNELKKYAQIYYAHPYSSWERGANERENGMLRRHFPKGQTMTKITKRDVQKAQDWLNNYPRKILNGKTAKECFESELSKISQNIT